jgi:hypothetical protein
MKPLLLFAAFTLSAAARTTNYFPLEVGNAWTYRPAATNRLTNQDARTITVHGKQTIAGHEYFQVRYFNREVLLRIEPTDASILRYDTESVSEQPWLSLTLPVGSTFPTAIEPCSTRGTIESRDDKGVVQVRFSGNCADAGLTQQFYSPNIGLISTEETSFIGPVKFELAEYHVGSNTVRAPELAFTVAIDSPSYLSGATVKARITLKNSSPDAIHLTFPSGQTYDLRILDRQGSVVYSWSKGQVFSQIYRDETFGPGAKTFYVSAPLGTLAPGIYKVEAWLTTSPVMYLGNVSFEVQ